MEASIQRDLILKTAYDVLEIEIEGLKTVQKKLGQSFVLAIELILQATGRVVITGIGKSGLIGRKIVATLSSAGTPALFLHPAEALHGDLGMVTSRDILLAISNSGETEEVIKLLPIIKNRGVKIIAFTGDIHSTLAKQADIVVDIGVPREACPLGLAPTSSTTATLAVGDALAMTLAKIRNLRLEDFRQNHPGGTLGERLKVKVSEIMLTGDCLPMVGPQISMEEALLEMNAKRLGCLLVMDNGLRLVGIITDGDLRRAMIKFGDIRRKKVSEIMTTKPKTIREDQLAAEALERMEKNLITVLPVVNKQQKVVGILHLHEILGKGQFKFTGV